MGRGLVSGSRPVLQAGRTARRHTHRPGAVEVTSGRALVRIVQDRATVVSEVRDPLHPPASKLGIVAPVGPRKPERTPLVTVSVDADGRPTVRVEGGSARVRILNA